VKKNMNSLDRPIVQLSLFPPPPSLSAQLAWSPLPLYSINHYEQLAANVNTLFRHGILTRGEVFKARQRICKQIEDETRKLENKVDNKEVKQETVTKLLGELKK
jgi:hypothetical protein